jgi:hypothetical protein
MKLQDQVCTINQAKRLKELGVFQESLFYHHPKFETPALGEASVKKHGTQYKVTQVKKDTAVALSAFTVAELGVMHDCFSVTPGQFETEGKFGFPGGKVKGENDYFPTEAQARAQWIIIALEKGWTTADQVNQRLKAA